MKNLWNESHKFILNAKVGDFYLTGDKKIYVTKRTPNRIYFSNKNLVTIKKTSNFYYLSGKNVNQILRDIEGFFLYSIHNPYINNLF